MKTTATNRKLRQLLTAIRDGTLIPRPEFQRRLVWANRHKISFIGTVLEKYPFPEIYVAAGEVDPDTGNAVEYLVDGQQRLTTLYQYFNGDDDLTLPKNFRKFSELTNEEKKDFLQYEVVTRDLGEAPMEQILEVFTRINSTNYSLNAMEIQNARYDGELKKFSEEVAGWDFFEEHRVFTATDVKRMNDLRYILIIIITIMSAYFNRSEQIVEYLVRYNDDFSEAVEIKRSLVLIRSFITRCNFPSDCRVWKKADLFTLFVELYRFNVIKGGKLSTKKVSKDLQEFYTAVDEMDKGRKRKGDVYEYHMAAVQASNDRSNRVKRGKIIEKILTGDPDGSLSESRSDKG